MEEFKRMVFTHFVIKPMSCFQFSAILNQRLTQYGHWLPQLRYKMFLAFVVHI